MPCGLLYLALLVTATSANTLDGVLLMALFAFGASLSMLAGPWLWLRLGVASNCGWGMSLGRAGAGRKGFLGHLDGPGA